VDEEKGEMQRKRNHPQVADKSPDPPVEAEPAYKRSKLETDGVPPQSLETR